jgi:hypothetical protein
MIEHKQHEINPLYYDLDPSTCLNQQSSLKPHTETMEFI